MIGYVQAREIVELEGPCVASPGRSAGYGVFVDIPGRFKHMVCDGLVTSVVANRFAQRLAYLVRALGIDTVQVIGVGGEDLGQIGGKMRRNRGGWLRMDPPRITPELHSW